jgi:hypothetical protein
MKIQPIDPFVVIHKAFSEKQDVYSSKSIARPCLSDFLHTHAKQFVNTAFEPVIEYTFM